MRMQLAQRPLEPTSTHHLILSGRAVLLELRLLPRIKTTSALWKGPSKPVLASVERKP